MKKVFEQILASAIAWLLVGPAMADELLSAEAARSMRSLDDQVQQIKSDVLDIATELNLLEEELLFPSNTQLAVFIALEPENAMRLDAVELSVNGQPATHYIYSFKELEALQQGGVQRLYTGNLPRGAHSLDVHLVGKSPACRTSTKPALVGSSQYLDIWEST